MASFPVVKSTAPSASMGTSRRFPMAKPTPGPGHYNESFGKEFSLSQYSSMNSPAFGSKTRSKLPKPSDSAHVAQRSMFGAQASSVLVSSPSPTFGGASRYGAMSATPGPSAYSPESSAFTRSMEQRERSFGSEERFNFTKPSYEQMTPGPHSAGFDSIASHALSDWANAPSFSFGGKSCEAVALASQGRGWRSQGVFGRRAAALHTRPTRVRPLDTRAPPSRDPRAQALARPVLARHSEDRPGDGQRRAGGLAQGAVLRAKASHRAECADLSANDALLGRPQAARQEPDRAAQPAGDDEQAQPQADGSHGVRDAPACLTAPCLFLVC